MAFEPKEFIPSSPSASKLNETGCLVRLARCGIRPALLSINLSEDICDDAGIGVDCKMQLYLGTGSDAGVIQLRSKNDGPLILRKKTLKQTTFYSLSCGHVREMPNRAEKSQACNAKAVNTGVIEIFLPKWPEKAQVSARGEASQANDKKQVSASANQVRGQAGQVAYKPRQPVSNSKKGGFDHREAIRNAANKVPAKLVGE